jgi:hypothetical protein
VIRPVRDTLLAHKKEGFKIIICTGRDAICEDDTKKWLELKGIPYDELHMRPRGTTLPDWVIKERMWIDISGRYCIAALYDDRNSVVKHARLCGLTVFQVAEGDF